MEKEMKLKVGDPAPDFAIPNQNGETVALKDLKGKKVLLSFHPLAFTPICEIQMKGLEAKNAVFEELNTTALGISVDSGPAKKAWGKEIGVEKTPLIADFWPHGDVAKKYDIFIEEKGISGRGNILIDEKGKIEWIKVYPLKNLPDIEEVISVIRGEK